MHTLIDTHMSTRTHAHMRCSHTYIHAYTHTRIRAYKQAHTVLHAHTYFHDPVDSAHKLYVKILCVSYWMCMFPWPGSTFQSSTDTDIDRLSPVVNYHCE